MNFTCMLAAAALSLTLAVPAHSQTGVAEPAWVALEIVDATGAVVGRWNHYQHSVYAKVKKIVTTVSLQYSETDPRVLRFNEGGSLYFQSQDCSGPPLVAYQQESGTRPAVTFRTKKDKWRLYIASTPTFQPLTAFSELRSGEVCSMNRRRDINAAVALDPVNLDNQFTQPFTLR